jgi:pimeloyl-ACP methyl ester carboxylesterase
VNRRIVSVIIATLLAVGAACGEERSPVASRHVIYLHGRIVQDQQSVRPRHPEHGYYEFNGIVEAFRKRGFIVTAEVRRKDATVTDAADAVVRQVRALLEARVSPERITVVGASMGAAIALRVSARLNEPRVRFAVIGPCISVNIPAVAAEEGAPLKGRLLSIREESDVPSSDCVKWSDKKNGMPGLHAQEIVVNTGLGHGFLYRPIPEWLEPVVNWANGE